MEKNKIKADINKIKAKKIHVCNAARQKKIEFKSCKGRGKITTICRYNCKPGNSKIIN